jgi:hypothetical protein
LFGHIALSDGRAVLRYTYQWALVHALIRHKPDVTRLGLTSPRSGSLSLTSQARPDLAAELVWEVVAHNPGRWTSTTDLLISSSTTLHGNGFRRDPQCRPHAAALASHLGSP